MQAMRMRAISRLSVIAAVVAVALIIVVYGLVKGASHPPSLTGQDLGGAPAPGFQLTDQNGQSVALQGLRGHPVALTFMYTSCPAVCPLPAPKLGAAAGRLGAR